MLPQLGWRFPDGKPEQHWRNFTVRGFDPVRATIDVDVFLHGDLGRASAWAMRAAVGDPVGFAGPRTHWEPDPEARGRCWSPTRPACPRCWRSSRRCRPATARSRSPRSRVTTSGSRSSSRAARRPALDLARRPPGRHDEVLADALRRLRLPPERGQAWGGGEALAMRDVRRHLVANHPAIVVAEPHGLLETPAHARGRRVTASFVRPPRLRGTGTHQETGRRLRGLSRPVVTHIQSSAGGFHLQCTGVASPYSSAFSLSPVWRRPPPARPRRGHLPRPPRSIRAS